MVSKEKQLIDALVKISQISSLKIQELSGESEFDKEFNDQGEPQKPAEAARADLDEKLLQFIRKVNETPPQAQSKTSQQLAFAFPNPPAKVYEMPYRIELPQPSTARVDTRWRGIAQDEPEAANG